jgi:hypothetical protein
MSNYSIYPQPAKVKYRKGQISVQELQGIYIEEFWREREFLKWVKAIHRAANSNFSLSFSQNKGSINSMISLLHDEKIEPQGYRLEVARDGMKLVASDIAGMRYCVDTLCQIVTQALGSGECLSFLQISDKPDFLNRGIMLDVSRCKVPNMDTLKGYVRMMAKLRLNQLQLYTEHTFAYKDHEAVWYESSPLTAQEVRELDLYCLECGVELVPNMNSFGHFERWLRHSKYKDLAESPDGFVHPVNGAKFSWGTTLYPDKKSLKFVSSLFDEFLPNFSSKHFNIGGDETWELGIGRSKARAEKIGKQRVYFDFLKKIYEEVDNRGRQMMFWGDIIIKSPELIKELPKNIIAMNWGYEASSPFAEQCPHFKNAEVPFYVCPGTSSWNAISGRWTNSLQNLRNAAIEGKKNGAIGYLITDWGDGGHHQMPEISIPSFVAGAIFSWNYRSNHSISISEVVDQVVYKDYLLGSAGGWLINLGSVPDLGDWHPINSTIINHLLFENNYDRVSMSKTFPGLNKKVLLKFDKYIATLDENLKELAPKNEEGELILSELKHSLSMTKFALAKFGYKTGRDMMKEDELRVLGKTLIRNHSELWLKRNRVGGLVESLERLKSAVIF